MGLNESELQVGRFLGITEAVLTGMQNKIIIKSSGVFKIAFGPQTNMVRYVSVIFHWKLISIL